MDRFEIDQGATVKFRGGLGRGEHVDPETLHTGIVNGPVQFQAGGGAFVPIHVRELNHNLLVVSTNIVEVVRA